MEETPYAIPIDDEPVKEVAVFTPEGSANAHPDKDASGITLGKWDVGFCGCCTHCVPNCLMAACCPCISVAQISDRLGMTDYRTALLLFLLALVLSGGVAHVVLFVWIWQARQLTRERFKIPGGCCGDYCAAFWCPCCTLAQIATHIKSYKPGNCDFGPQDTLPRYTRE